MGLRSLLLPLAVLVLSLAATAGVWYSLKFQAETNAAAAFDGDTLQIAESINARMLAYEDALQALVGLFSTSSTVTREDWRRFIDRLELRGDHPGIDAFGYAQRLDARQLAGHELQMRNQGLADYRVWPAARRDDYLAIVDVEPESGDLSRLRGFNLLTDAVSRVAMEQAARTGAMTLTARWSGGGDAGAAPKTLLLAPLYRDGVSSGEGAAAGRVTGYVFALIDCDDMMTEALKHSVIDVGLAVHDGYEVAAKSLLYANPRANAVAQGEFMPAFSKSMTTRIAGRDWTLQFSSAPYRQAVPEGQWPAIALAAGVPLSLLLFGIAWSQATLRLRATRLAAEMTISLRAQAEERARLEASLQQAGKLEAIGTLAGGIAHDFNNILSAILGYGELAQNAAASGSATQRYLDNIMSAGQRAKSLVARILAFSRSGLGQRVPVHVQSVIAETLELLQASCPEGVQIKSSLMTGDAAVLGDPDQIHQIALNLGTNALQAMRQGGTLTVRLDLVTLTAPKALAAGTAMAGEYVCLAVSDTGGGIELNLRPRIFDPFFTTKGVGVGTGLGLSLVHGIATDLGGGVDLQSVVGAGTTFSVYLPMSGRTARPLQQREALPLGNGEIVMLVDDEETLVRLGEEMLAALGYEPAGFTSAAEALEAFRRDPGRFSALLSDETMPEMTGSELAAQIRATGADLPIILMSGYATPALAARAAHLSVLCVLNKPLDSGDMARSLERALLSTPAAAHG